MKPTFSTNVYEFLKNLVQLYLPAFGAFYVTLGSLWGLPATTQVAGTCLAVAAFLGACLRISTKNYNADGTNFDGAVVATPGEGGPDLNFALSTEQQLGIPGKKTITLRVHDRTK